MFDARKLDSIARKVVFDEARKKIGVGKKMFELLDWDRIEQQARVGLWSVCLRPKEFARLFNTALYRAEYDDEEVDEITTSSYKVDLWSEHFDGFQRELEDNGFTVTFSWERLSESHYEFAGKNNFSPEYESKRNLWLKKEEYWGRPTVIIGWGKSIQLDDAIEQLRKEDSGVGEFQEEEGFLNRI